MYLKNVTLLASVVQYFMYALYSVNACKSICCSSYLYFTKNVYIKSFSKILRFVFSKKKLKFGGEKGFN